MTESCFFVRMKWSFLRITWAWCYKFPKGSQTERESLVKLGEACVCLWIGHCAAPSLHLAAAHTTITSWTADAFSLFPSLAELACLSPTRCFSCQLRLIRRLLCTDWNTVRLAKYSTKCLCWNSSLWMCSDLSTPFYIAISEISRGLKALSSFFFFSNPELELLAVGQQTFCTAFFWSGYMKGPKFNLHKSSVFLETETKTLTKLLRNVFSTWWWNEYGFVCVLQ